MPIAPVGDLDRSELAALIARAEPARLLPSGYGGEPVDRPLTLCDATALGPDRWLAVVRSESGTLFAAPVVALRSPSAREPEAASEPVVRRAVPGDHAAQDLLALLDGTSYEPRPAARSGGFTVVGLAAPRGNSNDDLGGDLGGERAMLVDQTHESVVVDERQVVKWAVRAEPTPAPTLVAHLSETGFTEMARPTGFVTWSDGESDVLVASAVAFLEGASDGWTWAVDDAGGFATGATPLAAATSSLGMVGELVADLHASLATPTSVLPVPRTAADSGDAHRWHQLAVTLLEQAIAEVDGDEGERLRQRELRIRESLSVLGTIDTAPVIPVHGDLHVGQILRWDGGYAVGDFDGNPVLPALTRLEPEPAARDVAGMLQSLDHVGRVVNRRLDGADPVLTEQWIGAAQSTFVGAYLARLQARGARDLFDGRLLLPFQVEQECREFLYAVRHLQRWRYVPDQALQALITVD